MQELFLTIVTFFRCPIRTLYQEFGGERGGLAEPWLAGRGGPPRLKGFGVAAFACFASEGW